MEAYFYHLLDLFSFSIISRVNPLILLQSLLWCFDGKSKELTKLFSFVKTQTAGRSQWFQQQQYFLSSLNCQMSFSPWTPTHACTTHNSIMILKGVYMQSLAPILYHDFLFSGIPTLNFQPFCLSHTLFSVLSDQKMVFFFFFVFAFVCFRISIEDKLSSFMGQILSCFCLLLVTVQCL